MKKYVMKKKMEELLKRHSGPGPAKYALPGTIGITTRDPSLRRSPAFSFGQRNEIQSGDCSPGPKYAIKPNSTQRGVETAPRFSLYSRPAELKPPLVPGPGKEILINVRDGSSMIWQGGGALPALVWSCVGNVRRPPTNIQQYSLDYYI
jgi:hypothetical protein